MDTQFWNPRTETLDREALEALQLEKLRRTVERASRSNEWHAGRLREAGVEASGIRSLEDLRRIPFMTREAWMESQIEDPPFGALLAAPEEVAIRYHTTSGTTGKRPLAVLDGTKDWDWISEMWCYALWAAGIRPADKVFLAFSYGTFIGFWGAHYASEKVGCTVLPGGNMTTEGRVRLTEDCGATVVCSTPTYALRLAQEAESLGIDLPAGPVRRLILSGEPAGSIAATKALIERRWGAKALDTAGMTEVGTLVMFECEHQPGGPHIIEDHYIEEVIDPDSAEPVADGELGERVVTSFGRGFVPVLRYRTRDMVVRVPADRCRCGRGFDIYEGGIQGRADDMKVVRGTNVYPRAIEEIVRRRLEGLQEFQIRLYTADGVRDEIETLVETDESEAALEALAEELSEAHEGLRIRVRRVPAGELPRFELKAKRLLDERQVWGDDRERKAT